MPGVERAWDSVLSVSCTKQLWKVANIFCVLKEGTKVKSETMCQKSWQYPGGLTRGCHRGIWHAPETGIKWKSRQLWDINKDKGKQLKARVGSPHSSALPRPNSPYHNATLNFHTLKYHIRGRKKKEKSPNAWI